MSTVLGSKEKAVISKEDRYGFPVRGAMCLTCGLIFMLDRFTAEGYARFYRRGDYRSLIASFKNKPQTIRRIRAAQKEYAANLIHSLEGHIAPETAHRLLDIGGSTGLVAEEFVLRYGFNATIIDPAPDEVAAVKAPGVDTVVGSIETWDAGEKFDLILLCRSIEHLFDLRAALTKIHHLLKPDGLLFCDIADFIEICRREGPPRATTKIDHCFWLCQETMTPIFRSMGFGLAAMFSTLPPDQVGFLFRKRPPAPLQPVSNEWIHRQLRRFREIETDWRRFGGRPLDGWDWLRRKGYNVKKKIVEVRSIRQK